MSIFQHLGVIFEGRGWGDKGGPVDPQLPSYLLPPKCILSHVYRFKIFLDIFKKRGKEWVYVKIIELNQHKCCKLVFVADASCIRKHFLIQLVG